MTKKLPPAPSDRELRSRTTTEEINETPIKNSESLTDLAKMEEAIKNLNATLIEQRAPYVNTPTFSGETMECVNEFLTFYEHSAILNKWSDEQKSQHLYVALKGEARKWFILQLPLAEKYTWNDWRTKLRATFRTPNFQEMSHLHLQQRVQALDESPEKFFYDILSMCARVNPHMTEGEKVRHLLKGVRPELIPSLMIMNPTTSAEFLNHLQQLARTRMMMKNNAFFSGPSDSAAYHLPFADLAAMTPNPPHHTGTVRDLTVRSDDLRELVNILRPTEGVASKPIPDPTATPAPEPDAIGIVNALKETAQAMGKVMESVERTFSSRSAGHQKPRPFTQHRAEYQEHPPRSSHLHHTAYLGVTTDSDPKKQVNESPIRASADVKYRNVTRMLGTVQWFNVKKRYGFIRRSDTREDVFVHQTAVTKNHPKQVQSLERGEIVEFNVAFGKKGCRAIKVTGPKGAPLQATQRASKNPRIHVQHCLFVEAPRNPARREKNVESRSHRRHDFRKRPPPSGNHQFYPRQTRNNFGRRPIILSVKSKEREKEILDKITALCREKNQVKNTDYANLRDHDDHDHATGIEERVTPDTVSKQPVPLLPIELSCNIPVPSREASFRPDQPQAEPPCETSEHPQEAQTEVQELQGKRYPHVTNFLRHMFFASVVPSKIQTL